MQKSILQQTILFSFRFRVKLYFVVLLGAYSYHI